MPEVVVKGSNWTVEKYSAAGQVAPVLVHRYRLDSCPAMYRRNGSVPALEQCVPCEKGTECVADQCINCTACNPGYFTPALSLAPCQACPVNTYVLEATTLATQSSDCLPCPSRSTTQSKVGQVGISSCKCDNEYYKVHQGAANSAFTCRVCPAGAMCTTQSRSQYCPLEESSVSQCVTQHNNSERASTQGNYYEATACCNSPVLGIWNRIAASGTYGDYFELTACPAGYQRNSNNDSSVNLDQQTCQKCVPEGATYIIHPNTDQCQTCPPGLVCFGNETVVPTVPGSVWTKGSDIQLDSDETGSFYWLSFCPAHYRIINYTSTSASTTSSVSFKLLRSQAKSVLNCVPCLRGAECPDPPCIECSPCRPGFYKVSDAAEPCLPCPINTYNPKKGSIVSRDCLNCQDGSTTEGLTGRVHVLECKCDPQLYPVQNNSSIIPQCMKCPSGAICTDRSCALQWSGLNCSSLSSSSIIGDWSRQPLSSGDDHFKLTGCPPGTELQTEEEMGTPDLQQCKPCASGTEYIIDPNSDICEKCPLGASYVSAVGNILFSNAGFVEYAWAQAPFRFC